MRQPFIDPSSSQHCTLTSLQGLSMASMKRHFGLAPLAVIMSAGMAFVTAYIIRLSTKTTDIQARTNTTPRTAQLNMSFKDKCIVRCTFCSTNMLQIIKSLCSNCSHYYRGGTRSDSVLSQVFM